MAQTLRQSATMHAPPTSRHEADPGQHEKVPARADEHAPWTCPFCPLLCDDIALVSTGTAGLAAPRTQCSRLEATLIHLENADANPTQPMIDGCRADPASALARAAQILSRAKRPLFGGLATDVAGARALYELAAHCGAILDHLHGDALAAGTFAMQDRGAAFTTLSEVRSRADLLVVFACEPSRRYPRFYERVVGAKHGQSVVFVGCETDPAFNGPSEAMLQGGNPFELLAQWSALLESGGKSIGSNRITEELGALSERINAASYTAFVYEPAALPGPHAALAIEALHRIVKAINRTARAGALALTGDDGALTVNQVVTWLSGFPLRTRVAAGLPLDHDAHRYRTDTLLSRHEIDAMLWISSFTPELPPVLLNDDVPMIVLGHPATALSSLNARHGSTVFIPVATPGIDCGGHLFRVDASVVTRLAAARAASLPSVAQIANELINARRSS
ncbi:MAG TPA: formylmethanofuran dehydrogenase [Trinickia sp.]|uniref:formylmethanofuran dehydrogenase n=1 Tax=Trinickia sp. TaxID=2571163 RepID=UPI002C31FE94|nr:formylmethanofuran dehydrogenase [Trinickia sp.]HTI17732.1 formylmethanofuran dehydrogenase [Trinickia sp.]